MTDWTSDVSVIVAAISAAVASLVFRRNVLRTRPLAEPTFAWKGDPVLGRFIEVRLALTNRRDDAIVIQSAAVTRPRTATITEGALEQYPMLYLQRVAGAHSQRKIDLAWTLPGRGAGGGPLHRALYVFPPGTWNGGKIRIDLRATSKANMSMFLARRIAVTGTLPQCTGKATGDTSTEAV